MIVEWKRRKNTGRWKVSVRDASFPFFSLDTLSEGSIITIESSQIPFWESKISPFRSKIYLFVLEYLKQEAEENKKYQEYITRRRQELSISSGNASKVCFLPLKTLRNHFYRTSNQTFLKKLRMIWARNWLSRPQ